MTDEELAAFGKQIWKLGRSTKDPIVKIMSYYNENDPYAAQWLRNLIAEGHIASGDVDDRSIALEPDDLKGYTPHRAVWRG